MTNTNAKVIAATTVWKMLSHLAGKPNAMLYSNHSRSAVSSVQATPGREDTRSRRCGSRLPGGRTLSGATLLVIATVNRHQPRLGERTASCTWPGTGQPCSPAALSALIELACIAFPLECYGCNVPDAAGPGVAETSVAGSAVHPAVGVSVA